MGYSGDGWLRARSSLPSARIDGPAGGGRAGGNPRARDGSVRQRSRACGGVGGERGVVGEEERKGREG
uniref:Uncharacterized protein n=1 Tax=Arundo donax TaxID=35708 RepID=A0A0A9FYG8_ARUDO